MSLYVCEDAVSVQGPALMQMFQSLVSRREKTILCQHAVFAGCPGSDCRARADNPTLGQIFSLLQAVSPRQLAGSRSAGHLRQACRHGKLKQDKSSLQLFPIAFLEANQGYSRQSYMRLS